MDYYILSSALAVVLSSAWLIYCRKKVCENRALIAYLKEPNVQLFDYLTNCQKREVLGFIPHAIRYAAKPTYSMKLTAVKCDGETLQYIDFPDTRLQRAAVVNNGNAIRYIKNPSLELQLLAVTQNPAALTLIKKPYKQVQLVALQRSHRAIAHIDNPDDEMVLLALSASIDNAAYIKQFSLEMQYSVLQQHYGSYVYAAYAEKFDLSALAVAYPEFYRKLTALLALDVDQAEFFRCINGNLPTYAKIEMPNVDLTEIH